MRILFLILLGLSEGIVVGGALVAFLMVLEVVPRLIDLSDSGVYIKVYQRLIVIGILTGTIVGFYDFKFPRLYLINGIVVVIVGLFFGIFIGALAAALTEVLKVLPILAKRLKLENQLEELLFIIVLGKVVGSLLYWSFPSIWK